MTRTGLSPRLGSHLAEPFLEVHPEDARQLGLVAAGLALVQNPQGSAILRVLLADRVKPGHPFAPMHWTGETGPTGRIDAVVPPLVDHISGQPDSKGAAVQIAPFKAAWYGFAIATRPFRPDCDYWATSTLADGSRAEIAGAALPHDWEEEARRMFGLGGAVQTHRYEDRSRGHFRIAFSEAGRLVAALFVAPDPVSAARSWLSAQIGQEVPPAILSGHPGADRPDPGAIVCACFGVGVHTILRLIRSGECLSVEEIGRALKAGTNCGSCKPELAQLVSHHRDTRDLAAE